MFKMDVLNLNTMIITAFLTILSEDQPSAYVSKNILLYIHITYMVIYY